MMRPAAIFRPTPGERNPMSALPQSQRHLSPQAYLAHERQAAYKSEYVNGEMFALAGVNKMHSHL